MAVTVSIKGSGCITWKRHMIIYDLYLTLQCQLSKCASGEDVITVSVPPEQPALPSLSDKKQNQALPSGVHSPLLLCIYCQHLWG